MESAKNASLYKELIMNFFYSPRLPSKLSVKCLCSMLYQSVMQRKRLLRQYRCKSPVRHQYNRTGHSVTQQQHLFHSCRGEAPLYQSEEKFAVTEECPSYGRAKLLHIKESCDLTITDRAMTTRLASFFLLNRS